MGRSFRSLICGRVNWLSRFYDVPLHFLYSPKENEAKERASVSLGPSDFLALLEVAGSLKTRFAQTVQTPKSAPSVVLSQCQWDEV
ncbi:MAG: hypothetical protein KKA76_06405, partial [Proteobacteria bacterium]|nr:hypothetical protein [Pseudomonadota bacterium]